MPVTVTLGFQFHSGDRVTPESLHRLVDESTLSGFSAAELGIDLSDPARLPYTYGNTRPAGAVGRIHYDTTPGLEGLYYWWASASDASVAGWLCQFPRRECYLWSHSGVTAGALVFLHRLSESHASAPFGHFNEADTVYDGTLFLNAWVHSGASGARHVAMLALESALPGRPVKCLSMGLVPDSVLLKGYSASPVSTGDYLHTDFVTCSDPKSGRTLPANNFAYGLHTCETVRGHGALFWGVAAYERT